MRLNVDSCIILQLIISILYQYYSSFDRRCLDLTHARTRSGVSVERMRFEMAGTVTREVDKFKFLQSAPNNYNSIFKEK